MRVAVLAGFALFLMFTTETMLYPARKAALKPKKVASATHRSAREDGTVKEFSAFFPSWKTKTARNLRSVEIRAGYYRKTVWSHPVIFPTSEMRRALLNVEKIPSEQIVLLNENGQPEKIYDLFGSKKIKMVATAYWVGDPQVPGTITFSGHAVRRGLVAVDPGVIPMGTRLYVPGYGYAYTSDTGSAIKGNRIDLFVEDKHASRPWEHKSVDVYVFEKAAQW
ncbi:MAG: 3D domain-containing protein [Elusimicrobia bacterium]|nr:3D domain-containing protein [Elusimicrobiota bacterium]